MLYRAQIVECLRKWGMQVHVWLKYVCWREICRIIVTYQNRSSPDKALWTLFSRWPDDLLDAFLRWSRPGFCFVVILSGPSSLKKLPLQVGGVLRDTQTRQMSWPKIGSRPVKHMRTHLEPHQHESYKNTQTWSCLYGTYWRKKCWEKFPLVGTS